MNIIVKYKGFEIEIKDIPATRDGYGNINHSVDLKNVITLTIEKAVREMVKAKEQMF